MGTQGSPPGINRHRDDKAQPSCLQMKQLLWPHSHSGVLCGIRLRLDPSPAHLLAHLLSVPQPAALTPSQLHQRPLPQQITCSRIPMSALPLGNPPEICPLLNATLPSNCKFQRLAFSSGALLKVSISTEIRRLTGKRGRERNKRSLANQPLK